MQPSGQIDDQLIVTLSVGKLRELIEDAAYSAAQKALAEARSEWLTTAQAAEQYGVSRSTITAAVSAGEFTPEHRSRSGGRGKTHRFKRSTFEAWLGRR